uniref:Phosphatidic acid phosphatase type 2/haloperoxidase domain-containing protein n=1 Tax=Kalanchoe fedtschenkoi TaxID=63787 RepID=A0A7N0ZZD2_KALFE
MASSPPPSTVVEPPPPPENLLGKLISFDRDLSLHLHTICQTLVPRFLLQALEISGDGRYFFPIVISLLLAPLPHLHPFLSPLLLGALLDLVVIGTVKYAVRRPRPVYNKGMHLAVAVDHWSFPSGHSSRVFMIAGFCYLVWDETVGAVLMSEDGGVGGESLRLGLWVVCGWAVLTSVSRVLLGRHFVFDVVAGAFLGVAEALIAFRYLRF